MKISRRDFLLSSAVTPFFGLNTLAKQTKIPTLFVHGLTSSAQAWTPIASYLREEAGWRYGGELIVSREGQWVYQPEAKDIAYRDFYVRAPRPADFYLMNFSDYKSMLPSQSFIPRELAEEVSLLTDYICQLNKTDKIILVGHSMGALAVWAYAVYYGIQKIERIILVAGPLQGSAIANLDMKRIQYVKNFFDKRNLHRNSRAVLAMKPFSAEMQELTELANQRNFRGLEVICVIVTDTAVNAKFLPLSTLPLIRIGKTEGDFLGLGFPNDGVVPFSSQDIMQIPGARRFLGNAKVTREIHPSRTWNKPEFAHSAIMISDLFIRSMPSLLAGDNWEISGSCEVNRGQIECIVQIGAANNGYYDPYENPMVWKNGWKIDPRELHPRNIVYQGKRALKVNLPDKDARYDVAFAIGDSYTPAVSLIGSEAKLKPRQ